MVNIIENIQTRFKLLIMLPLPFVPIGESTQKLVPKKAFHNVTVTVLSMCRTSRPMQTVFSVTLLNRMGPGQ